MKRKRILSTLVSAAVLVSSVVVPMAGAAAEEVIPGTGITEDSLLYLVDDQFTKLAGQSDTEIQSVLENDMGYVVTETGDLLKFSATEDKGLYMERTKTDAGNPILKMQKTFTGADGNTNNTALYAGQNMKKGRYLVDYTVKQDNTGIFVESDGANWKNINLRITVDAAKKTTLNVQGLSGTQTITAGQDIHMQYIFDLGSDCGDGNSSKVRAAAYLNGRKLFENNEMKYTTGGKNYYPTFLADMKFQLNGSTNATVGGMYIKNFTVAKIADDAEPYATELEKTAVKLSPQAGQGWDAVTGNLILPAAPEGYTVTWTSSNPSVISNTGAVTRQEEETAVQLKAEYKKDGAEETVCRFFDFTVKAKTKFEEIMQSITYADLTDAEDPGDGSPVQITENLKQPLPSTFTGGGTITWESTDETHITDAGAVTRPSKLGSDAAVTMTATFAVDGESDTKAFNFLVLKEEGEITIDDDANELRVENLLGKNPDKEHITTSLVLPNKGQYAGSDIAWTSDAEDIIDPATGLVTRPRYGDDVLVTLTATFTKGDETREKTYRVTVLVDAVPVNVAAGKPATEGNFWDSAHTGQLAFDGDATTRWAARQAAVTDGSCWARVDLGTPTQVDTLTFYEFQKRMQAIKLEYSDTGETWKTAATETGIPASTSDKTDRDAYTVKFTPVTGRFFRFTVTQAVGDGPSIYEIQLMDSTKRYYSAEAAANDASLGTATVAGGPGFAAGETVTVTAVPSEIASFSAWILPDGVTLTQGSVTDETISFSMPAKNVKLTAGFARKQDGAISAESMTYDIYEKGAQHQPVTVTLTEGDYAFTELRMDKDTLTEGEEYTRDGNVFTIQPDYLAGLLGEHSLLFLMSGGDNPKLALTVVDTDPSNKIREDLAAVTLPPYELKSGMLIDAAGQKNGSDITITSSSEYVSVSRVTVDGKLMNQIQVTTPPTSQLLVLTYTGTLEGVSIPVSYKHTVAGSGGSSSGGSSGGGGGGTKKNNSSSSGIVSYGDGQPPLVPQETTPPQKDEVFTDLDSVAWAKESIELLAEKNIVSGDETGAFHPQRSVTREEFVKMLVLSLGLSADSEAVLPFEDVDSDNWSYPYIAAAREAGIIGGVTEDMFGFGQTMSRQDIAVATVRALEAAGRPLEAGGVAFADQNEIAEYARQSVNKIAASGIVNGYEDGSFRPEESITRAEAAKILAQIASGREAE